MKDKTKQTEIQAHIWNKILDHCTKCSCVVLLYHTHTVADRAVTAKTSENETFFVESNKSYVTCTVLLSWIYFHLFTMFDGMGPVSAMWCWHVWCVREVTLRTMYLCKIKRIPWKFFQRIYHLLFSF